MGRMCDSEHKMEFEDLGTFASNVNSIKAYIIWISEYKDLLERCLNGRVDTTTACTCIKDGD